MYLWNQLKEPKNPRETPEGILEHTRGWIPLETSRRIPKVSPGLTTKGGPGQILEVIPGENTKNSPAILDETPESYRELLEKFIKEL